MDGLISDIQRLRGDQKYVRLNPEKQELYLGIDIGSTSSDIVLLDSGWAILYSD
jgi:activator of 2-hydroxyglutaryl-CoA dehydratase